MNGTPDGYAVFFFPQALEALGEAIKPYLQDGSAGPHVVCHGIDTAGSLIELSLDGTTRDGQRVELELMVPSGMVRMIVSAHSDDVFGFGPHAVKGAVQKVAPVAADPQAQAPVTAPEGEGDAATPAETPAPAPVATPTSAPASTGGGSAADNAEETP